MHVDDIYPAVANRWKNTHYYAVRAYRNDLP